MKRLLLLAAAPDGQALRDRVAALLAGEGQVRTAPAAFPDGRDATRPTVALAVLSPGAEGDPAVLAFLDEAVRRRLPIVPVVDDPQGFDFSSARRPELRERNAVAVEPDGGEKLRQTVRGYFGLDVFPEKKKLFISYARRDGAKAAEAIYEDLWKHHFTVFRDIEQIEGGADFQERILEQILDKDFVLLLDTPAARESKWVRAEIVEAQSRRIPVRILQLGLDDPCPLMPSAPRMRWKDAKPKPKRLAKLRQFVAQGLAATFSFDERAERLFAELAELEKLRLERRDRRRLLATGGDRRVLFDIDPALPSLEGLHRLYAGYRETGECRAVLVSGDHAVGATTTAAVSWARGRAPLEVTSLSDLKTVFDRHFK